MAVIDYSVIVDEIIKHIIKTVYATEPSKASNEMPSWKLFRGESLENSNRKTRMFDVVCEEDNPTLVYTGNNSDDYDIVLNVELCYPNDIHANSIAKSDYVNIRAALLNSDRTELYKQGFNFFSFEDTPTIPAPDDGDDFRFMTMPVLCRITVDHANIFEEWQETVDTGDEYQDTTWSDDQIVEVVA